MKRSITLIFLFFTLYSYTQSIKGKIIDDKAQAVEFVTIALHSQKDSTLLKGEISTIDGAFEFTQIKPGNYFINCSFVGFEDYKSMPIAVSNADIDLGTITLKTSTEMLSTVTVKAKKPLIEIRADKMILNVEASVSAAGSNGLELLRKAPGVTVDNNENVQLKGKNGVRIYIDGKPSYLNPAELANLLKSMNASDIEAIEIITNPSAKFDAQGNAGIINIRLKKNKNFGTNGSVNVSGGYGKYHKSYLGVNLNNRNKKVNTFGSFGLGNNKYYNYLNLSREQDGASYDQKQTQYNNNFPLNAKVGLDFYASDKHTFGVLINANTQYKQNAYSSTSNTIISNLKTREKVDSTLQAFNTINSNNINTNANINYKYADTLGNEIVVDLDKGYYHDMSNSMQPNTYFNPQGKATTERAFFNETPSTININTAKIDYTKTLKKSGLVIGLGAKYANVKTDNTFLFYDVIDKQQTQNFSRSNLFSYTENVAAAYANLSGAISKKVNFQAGLRTENTHSLGDLTRLGNIPRMKGDSVAKDYTGYFPSAALTYSPNDKNSFNLTYSRRINRPNYQDLNPFEWRLDELTYRKGNPRLTPQYNNNFELTYTAMQMASLSLSYSKSTDVVTDIIERNMNEPGKSFISYRNIASQDNYAITLSSPLPIKSWWSGYLSATLYKAYYKATFPEYSFNTSTPIATNFYMEHTFTLPKDYNFEISGWFNSAAIWGATFITKPQGSLDLGIKKNLFNGRGNIKLSVTDILHTAPWRGFSDAIPGLKMSTNGNWESQQVKVNFMYRFGSNEIKSSRNRKTGLEDEKGRIK